MVSEMPTNKRRVFGCAEEGSREDQPSRVPSLVSLEWSSEQGSITVMTAICMVAFMLMLGLAIDVSRIYMVRAELQNAADAAALTAARELNGGTTGIDNAVTRANNIANTQGFGKAGVSIASVQFAINLNDDPYMDAASAKDATKVKNIRFVKVTTQATTTNILFAVSVLGNTHAESRSAVAGMSVGINGICKYFNIALAVDPVTNPNYTWPTGTTQILKFHDNVGTTITLQNMQYIVLDTSWVTGGGHNETVDATADVNPHCIGLGDIVDFSKSPSANNPNGMSIGTNTRLDVYTPPITCSDVKPDLNVYGKNAGESITLQQYLDGAPKTAPTTCTSGQSARRLIIFPVINTVVNGPTNGQVQQVRAFFLKQPINGTCDPNSPGGNKPCPPGTTAAGDMVVEYAGDNFVVGSGYYDPSGISTNLTIAVLYK
jgi:Flp pilus assembly protein TadG